MLSFEQSWAYPKQVNAFTYADEVSTQNTCQGRKVIKMGDKGILERRFQSKSLARASSLKARMALHTWF